MATTYANLAVEDELTERVVKTVIGKCGLDVEIVNTFGNQGNGYLRRGIRGFNEASRYTPFVVVTDLDDVECPPALVTNWFAGIRKRNSLSFNVAVREVEAWLMADRARFASHFSINPDYIPRNPEMEPDPKSSLIQAVRKSRVRAYRDSIVPAKGSIAQIGPDYNGALGEYVEESWRPTSASERSPSLHRLVERLSEIAS